MIDCSVYKFISKQALRGVMAGAACLSVAMRWIHYPELVDQILSNGNSPSQILITQVAFISFSLC